MGEERRGSVEKRRWKGRGVGGVRWGIIAKWDFLRAGLEGSFKKDRERGRAE